MRRELALHERLELVRERGAGRLPGLEHHEGLRARDAVLVGRADHRGLQHRRMLHQGRLDLERRDELPAHFQHVVAAARIDVIAGGVAVVLVAGARPRALESLGGFRAIAPVHERGARSAHIQVADLRAFDEAPVFATDLDLVSRHRLAARAVAHVPGAVGKEDVQHLGRADAVDHLAAVVRLEALADLLRQRLARGRTQAKRHGVALRQLGRGEHARVSRGRAEEQRRLRFGPALEDRLRRGPLRHEQHARAGGKRKGERVAEPVGEEELRRGKAQVALRHAEHAAPVELRRPVGIAVRVDGPLGPAGGARRIQPEPGVVRSRRRGRRRGCVRRKRIAQRTAHGRARGQRPLGPRDQHDADLVGRLLHRLLERGDERLGHQRRLRAAMAEDVGVILA